ncbi:MAG: CCA tRNA nucleotidyltransferase [Rhodospirillaceae bacterium]|nr:CCA tRNA nucleotidyltransferase [Rhodospirillaceae bacterium]
MLDPGYSETGRTHVVFAPNWMVRAPVRCLMQALAADGADVRFVGGCVRDALVGEDVVDLDVGVPRPPDAVMACLSAAGIKAVPTGLAQGTITAVLEDQDVEVTSLRRDIETDGRHAVVRFTEDWREDARRRDFTINALSMTPDGAIFDYCGGMADLETRTVRFVGDPEKRIREDALRILRFYRFVARFGLSGADALSRRACRDLAALVSNLSRERISQEIFKTLTARHAPDAVNVLTADKILDRAVVAPWAPDRFARMIALEEGLGLPADAGRRLVSLIADAAAVEPAVRSLNSSARTTDRLLAMVQHEPAAAAHWRSGDNGRGEAKRWRAAFYRYGAEAWRDATLLVCSRQSEAGDMLRLRALSEAADVWQLPTLPVRGADLVARGITGPAVGKGLDFIERWWVANDFSPGRAEALDKLEEAVALVRLLPKSGS